MGHKNFLKCTIMRGGTSKGIFLMKEDLPRDPSLRDRIILAIFGSPDVRQIDGLGGADSLTSKLALIAPSEDPDRDVNYTFGAVGIDRPFVDYSANCGNISSAVGPFAIDRGFVKPEEPITTVRIFNTNTRKRIFARVPVRKGKVISEGDYSIDGVPGTGAKIELSFMDPGGAATGKLVPTGNRVDELRLDTGEKFVVSIIDAGNPTAFVRAEDLGLKGIELPTSFDQDTQNKTRLEAIRKKVGDLIGVSGSPSIPKIAFVGPSQDFRTSTGIEIRKDEVDLVARVMAMGKMHKVYAITAAVPTAIGAVLPGSTVHEVMGNIPDRAGVKKVTIGHPSGKFEVEVESVQEGDHVRVLRCTIGRTARKIMEGRVYIPSKVHQLGTSP